MCTEEVSLSFSTTGLQAAISVSVLLFSPLPCLPSNRCGLAQFRPMNMSRSEMEKPWSLNKL